MIPIRVESVGGLGNTMFQYMFSKRLQSLVPDAVIGNVRLPEFDIELDDVELPENVITLSLAHHVDVLEIAHLLRSRVFDGVRMRAYVQRLEYYPDPAEAARYFPVAHPVDGSALEGALVINVRGNEVLRDVHEDYGPVPVDFFSQIADRSGLTPVIVGQLGDEPYSEEIRRRFSGCVFLESTSPVSDFELVRNAENIVFGVSTFSWLGAWLAPNAKQIFMPVSGIFNPSQRPEIDLLPLADDRYRFFHFSTESWSASERQLTDLVGTGKNFDELSRDDLRQRRREADADLNRLSQSLDFTQLTAARRQRDRLERRVTKLVEENRQLRVEYIERVEGGEAS